MCFQDSDFIKKKDNISDNKSMKNEWDNILKKVTFLMLLCFAVFIVGINLFKLLDFIWNIDNVVKTAMKDENTEIPIVDSIFNFDEEKNIPDFDQNVAHRAFDIGYNDEYDSVDLSHWRNGYNILIIGSDKHSYSDEKCRADVIMLLRIARDGQIFSMSIPRDTLVTIDNGKFKGSLDKIGHSLYWSDLDELVENVQKLVGVQVNSTITMDNFRSFEALMAVIGGVSTDKILEGKLGIQWIRNRSFKFGDIERCRRQQFFLKKTVEKLWRLSKKGNYIYSSIAYDSLKKIVNTDMSKKEFFDLLYILKINEFTPQNDFYTCVLPGTFGTYDSTIMKHDNLACWIPSEDALGNFRKNFDDEKQLFFEKTSVGFFDFFGYTVSKVYKEKSEKFNNYFSKKENERLAKSINQ